MGPWGLSITVVSVIFLRTLAIRVSDVTHDSIRPRHALWGSPQAPVLEGLARGLMCPPLRSCHVRNGSETFRPSGCCDLQPRDLVETRGVTPATAVLQVPGPCLPSGGKRRGTGFRQRQRLGDSVCLASRGPRGTCRFLLPLSPPPVTTHWLSRCGPCTANTSVPGT